MSVMHVLAASCFVFSAPLLAQEPAQEGPVDANSRVERILKTLRAASAWRCQATTTAKANQFVRQFGGGKEQVTKLTTVKEGEILCWSKDDAAQVLASRAGQWVTLDRDGDWIPLRRPVGQQWSSEHLPDLDFLTDRLLQLGKSVQWTAAGAEKVDDKECRVWTTKVELDDATHLVRTGALPAPNSLAGGIGRMVIMAGGPGMGAAPAIPEPEITFEIAIYEDPGTKLPRRISVKAFGDDNAGLGGGVVFQVAGQEQEEEEEEDADKAKKGKKPSATTNYDLDQVGEAKATELKPAARKILGLE